MVNFIASIRTEMLQMHLDGALKTPEQILEIVRKHQPPSGCTNQEWVGICEFILEIEHANIIPEAREIAEKYGLTLRY